MMTEWTVSMSMMTPTRHDKHLSLLTSLLSPDDGRWFRSMRNVDDGGDAYNDDADLGLNSL